MNTNDLTCPECHGSSWLQPLRDGTLERRYGHSLFCPLAKQRPAGWGQEKDSEGHPDDLIAPLPQTLGQFMDGIHGRKIRRSRKWR